MFLKNKSIPFWRSAHSVLSQTAYFHRRRKLELTLTNHGCFKPVARDCLSGSGLNNYDKGTTSRHLQIKVYWKNKPEPRL